MRRGHSLESLSVVAVPGDVVEVADRCITVQVPTGLITEPDEFGQPAVEAAPGRIAAHKRARIFHRSWGGE